jgi:hypothetical protein
MRGWAKSPRMELYVALYGQRARASIRGRWTLIRVGYRLGRSPSVITERIPRSLVLFSVSHHDLGRSLCHKPGRSFGIWIRLSKVAGVLDKISGPSCRSVGLLAGRVHLTGTSGTLPGRWGPWVPSSLKPPIDV